jgi:TonB-dependent starch-binding outer membrane protein SusC
MNGSRPNRCTSLLWLAVSALLVGTLAYPATADAQVAPQSTVTGTVTDALTGFPLAGVTVQVAATGAGTITSAAGRYTVQVPADGAITFTRIGYRQIEVLVGTRTTVDVQMEVSAAALEEVVVTGYASQRRVDITSAVSSVNMETANRETSSSVLQRLGGSVPGVIVEAGGSPGTRSTVRIRGISSFQNNNPLYIIDGTPVEESFANFLNPNDIESIQVLKDASAASIYGSRANNGVVIIETKKGRPGDVQVQLDAHMGMSRPVRGYDDFLILNSLDYFEFERRRYVNAGEDIPPSLLALYGDPNNPSVPRYIYAAPATVTGRDQWGRPTVNEDLYAFPGVGGNHACCLIMPGSPGTNWWGEVFGTGQVRDVNLSVLGGGARERYNIGFSVFDQEGTARFNRYQRGTARVNTSFDIGRLTVGENLTVAIEESYGGLAGDGLGEGNIIGKNILSQPVIPVRDIAGNFASGKGVGLGNNSNPVKIAEFGQDNRSRNSRIFGNAFARLAITDNLNANTHLGINYGEGSFAGFSPHFPENSEPTMNNQVFENNNVFRNWTWNNTLTFDESFADRHNLTVLLGQEASRGRSRFIGASMNNLVTSDINARYIQPALGDPATRNVTSSGGVSALLSYFGKADYNYDQRYYLSGTLRHDGSSRLGEANQWGTFPAFSAGWRLSEEAFMANQTFFTNIMLRVGWGITGNQNIAAGRTVDHFGGGVGSSFYDITGTGSSIQTGYIRTSIGNPNLRWEENRSTNIGMDLELFEGRGSVEVDLYQRDTDNLLFNPPLPATAGLASAPIVNIGKMRNRGIDVGIGYRGTLALGGGVGYNIDFNGAHYRNEIVRIDGDREFFHGPVSTRQAPGGVLVINQVGAPLGAFYGLIHEGTFQNQAEIDALNEIARQRTGDPNAVFQDGAAPGRFRFADLDGDGRVTASDRTIIGDPHPDFTAGLNLGLNWRNWDFGAHMFGTFGNDIFDVQKEFYVFAVFPTNVRRDLLTDSWTPDNPNAKYPRLDINDIYSNAPSSFWVEDGSYVRLRSLQVGYTVPPGTFGGFGNVRVYLRGENLFTITGYDGLDPSLPALSASSAGMDVRDQARGIDRGSYPTNRTISVGFNVGF